MHMILFTSRSAGPITVHRQSHQPPKRNCCYVDMPPAVGLDFHAVPVKRCSSSRAEVCKSNDTSVTRGRLSLNLTHPHPQAAQQGATADIAKNLLSPARSPDPTAEITRIAAKCHGIRTFRPIPNSRKAVFAIKCRLEPSDDLVFTVRGPLLMMVTMPNTILRRIIPILMTGMLTMQMMMLTTHAVFFTFRVRLLQCERCSSLSPRADTTTVLNALRHLDNTTLLLHLF